MYSLIIFLLIRQTVGYDLSWILSRSNVARSQSELIGKNKGEGSITLFSDNHAVGYHADALVDSFSKGKADSVVETNSLNIEQQLSNTDTEPLLAKDQEEAEKYLRIDREYVCNHVQSAANLFVKKAETVAEATSQIYSTTFVKTKNGKVKGETGGRAIAKARAILNIAISLVADAFNSHVAASVSVEVAAELNNVELAITDSLAHASALSEYHYGVADSDVDDEYTSKDSKVAAIILAKAFAAVFNCHDGIATAELTTNTTGTVKSSSEDIFEDVFLLKPPPPAPPSPPPAPLPSPPPPQPFIFPKHLPYLKDLDEKNQITYDKDYEVKQQEIKKPKVPWEVRLLRGKQRKARKNGN